VASTAAGRCDSAGTRAPQASRRRRTRCAS
jgi:hypothetical protein